MRRCLYCYEPLGEGRSEFHGTCSGKIFGSPNSPELPYTEDQMLNLAEEVIKSQTSVTGVQPKLSLHLEKLSKKGRPTAVYHSWSMGWIHFKTTGKTIQMSSGT